MPSTEPVHQPGESAARFEHEASQSGPGILREFFGYLSRSKKWWLTPIALMMLLLAVLIILGGSGAAPFIYTLF